jgi:predicted nucleic-acid-binding protein
VKITADTNLLVRVVVSDDAAQAARARAELTSAAEVAIPIPALCELVWVLRRAYGYTPAEIATAVETLVESAKVSTNRAAVRTGLWFLRAGGDFGDGVIAHQGAEGGSEVLVSFDEEAIALAMARGFPARTPGLAPE